MSKKGRTRGISWLLLPFGLAVMVTAVTALLFAYLMQNGIVQVTWSTMAQMVSISIAAMAAGKVSGKSGRRGLAIGLIIALIWCIWKLVASADNVLSVYTPAEILLCILCSWLGSCIFHKNRRGYTKRNRAAHSGR